MIIKVKNTSDNPLPQAATTDAAGLDVAAFLESPLTLEPGHWAAVPTGLYLEIAPGHEVQVRPRSGLALKYGVTLLNSPGTIDADYRGEVRVILINHGRQPFVIENGMRIAQLVAAQLCPVAWQETGTLTDTDRGTGGFGHTGI